MKLETKLGTLKVVKSGFTADRYPGFYITLVRNGQEHDIAMVEVDETEEEPVLKTHYWDCIHENPVFNAVSTSEDVEHFIF